MCAHLIKLFNRPTPLNRAGDSRVLWHLGLPLMRWYQWKARGWGLARCRWWVGLIRAGRCLQFGCRFLFTFCVVFLFRFLSGVTLFGLVLVYLVVRFCFWYCHVFSGFAFFCFYWIVISGLFSFAVLQHWFNSGERVKTQASFTSAGVPVSGSQAFPSFRRSRSLILFSEICSPGCSVKPVSGNLTIHWQHAGQHAGRWGTCVWQL